MMEFFFFNATERRCPGQHRKSIVDLDTALCSGLGAVNDNGDVPKYSPTVTGQKSQEMDKNPSIAFTLQEFQTY